MAEEYPNLDVGTYMTAPIVDVWTGLLQAGNSARRDFLDKYDQCYTFYSKATRFLWEDDFRTKYLGPNAPVPKFQVTVNKAFEYVSIFGPMLYWQNPTRRVTSKGSLNEEVMRLAGPFIESNPNLQQVVQQQQMFEMRDNLRNAVWESYLGQTPNEQPNGLRNEMWLAITESLLSGRGVVMPRTYGPADSDITLTGLFHVPVNRVLIDPESVKPGGADAMWMAVMHRDWYSTVERRFGFPKDSLRGKGTLSSISAEVYRIKPETRYATRTNDIICWYEIFTKCGLGAGYSENKRIDMPLAERFDELVGDYGYLCITESCKYPLNLPSALLGDMEEEEFVKRMSWPIPFWKDSRWPLEFLDYYADADKPWPLPPLYACIGEMICLQILLSIYLDNAHMNSQQIIGALRDAAGRVKEALKNGENPAVIEFSADYHKSVQEVIQFINKPNQNTDLLAAMEFCMAQIERKSGLSPLLYGNNPEGTQERSAEATKVRSANVNIRPEFMGTQVADFVSRASDLERILAYYSCNSNDVSQLLGPVGAYLWDELILADPEDVAVRGLRCRVEASDLRRPNKERDSQMLQSMMQTIIPMQQEMAAVTQDTGPINGFLKAIGRAGEMPVDEWLLPPFPDQSQQQQLQQAAAAAEVEKTQADAEKSRADAEAALLTAQQQQSDLDGEMALNDQQLQIKDAEARQKMQLQQAQGEQKLGHAEESHQQNLGMNMLKMWQHIQSKQVENNLKEQAAKAKMNQGA